MEEVVEVDGKFIWPRTARADGKMFGFNRQELARISAMYSDRVQFYAQYYNDPNDPESQRFDISRFQYYDKKHLKFSQGRWYFQQERLNVFAGIDFAFSLNKRADYSAVVVVGIDGTLPEPRLRLLILMLAVPSTSTVIAQLSQALP